ncbi:MAG: winged helix-turn-helix domain-containing protein [Nocardioidaceae bacterium]
MLAGQASDYLLEPTRRSILDYIREHESASPKVIAEALNISDDNATQTLRRMVDDGQLDQAGRGTYLLPVVLSLQSPSDDGGSDSEVTASPPRSRPPERESDSGDRSDIPTGGEL